MEEGRRNERVVIQKAWQESANSSHPARSLKSNLISGRAKGMTRSLPAGSSEKEERIPATEHGYCPELAWSQKESRFPGAT